MKKINKLLSIGALSCVLLGATGCSAGKANLFGGNDKVEKLETQLEAKDLELEEVTASLTVKTEALEAASTRVSELESANVALTAEKEALEEEIAELEEDAETNAAELENKRAELEALNTQLVQIETEKEALEEEISQLQLQIQEMDVSYTVSINKEIPSEVYFAEWTEVLSGIDFFDKDNHEVSYSTGYGTSRAFENGELVNYMHISLRVLSDEKIENVMQIEPVFYTTIKLKEVYDATYLGTPILRENSITFNMNDFSVPNPVIELSNGVSYTYSDSRITQVVGFNEIKNDSLMGENYLWKTVEGDSLTLDGTFTPGEKYLFLFDIVANYWRSDVGPNQTYSSTETVGIIVTMPEAIVE